MDDERIKAIAEFEHIYRRLQKKYNLLMHSCFRISGDNFIEIHEYNKNIKGGCICVVRDSDEVTCYKKAAETLRGYEMIRGDKDDCTLLI